MQQRSKLLEKHPITQRQALLVTLALYFLGTISLIALRLTAPNHNTGVLLTAGLFAAVLFGGAWYLYYRYDWEPVRYFTAVASTLVVALFLPEPFVSSYAPMVILLPIVLSLVVAGGVLVVLNSVLLIAILLARSGGGGVYAHPATLTLYAMIVGGLLVRRLIEASAFQQLKQAQETIKQSERQMRTLVGSLDDIVLQFDEQSTFLNVWTADESLLSHPKDRLLGKRIGEVLGEETGRPFEEAVRRVAGSGQPESVEYSLEVIGGRRWFNARINAVPDPGERPTVCMLIRDITERKQAEAVLQASEERYRMLFEENPLPLLVYDAGSLQLLAVNDAAAAQYGYERDELLQMSIREVRPQEDVPRLEAFLDRPRPRQERSGPWKQRKKDGTLFDVEVISNETSFLGRPARLVLINDITEQLQAKAALADSELRFRSLIENSADGITVVDSQGKVTYVSPSIERLLGYTPAEAAGRRAMDYVHREDRVRLLEHVARLNRDGEGHQVLEYRFKHKDGSWHCLESTLAHQLNLGAGRGIVFNYRDVTGRRQAERELETVYGQLRNIFDNLDEVFFSMDTVRGTFLQMSSACERVFGWPASAFGENPQLWRQLIHPDDLHIADASPSRLHAGESVLQEYRLHHFNGEVRWVETKLKPTLDPQNRLIRVDGIVSDITGRKQAESNLQASESRYRLATRATNDVIWEWNAVTDQLTWAENAQIVFGYSSEEIGADAGWWDEHIHPEDRRRVISGLQKLIAGRETVWSDEYRFLLKDGSYAIFSDRGYIERDASGNAIRMIGAISDITRRRQAEELLANSERRFRALIENGLDYISLLSAEGTLLWESPSNSRMLSYQPDEMLGQSVFGLVHPEDLEGVQQQFVELCRAPGSQTAGIFRIHSAGGAWLWVEAIATNLLQVPSVGAIVLNYRDVTERKQAEEQLRLLNLELEKRVAERTLELNRTNAELEHASRAKDEFLANMSHELRTPLNSILGLSESLLEQWRGPLNEPQQHSLRLIESSGRHLLDLINDVLDVSKIEAGKFDFYPETILVADLVQSSLAFVKSQALKKSIHVSYEADPSVVRIQADPRRLKQILVNLLTNAVKFTPEQGRVLLQVRGNAAESLVRFSVIDTGIGIAAQDLPRLFRPFEQVDSHLNRQYDGSGLGLALVQKLTDLHGGSVHVQSEVGKGSCFTVNLPWRKESELPVGEKTGPEKSSAAREASGATGENAAPITILLAEDHATNILTIGEYLESHGYRVVVAHDGVEALEKARETDPDLILMDVQMPVVDGLEATRRLRSQARFARTPVIALTALAMPGDRERCLQAGANEYMSKPVSLKSLVETIQLLLPFPHEKRPNPAP